MPNFVLFRLYAPLSSWGETAVGEVRPSGTHPSRSALLGMIAAAYGIKRDDGAAYEKIRTSFGFAVCMHNAGGLLRDYHTIQAPGRRKGANWLTRKDELAEMKLNTVLSSRDYRTEASYTVVVWNRDKGAEFTIEDLTDVLRKPRFVLYLGRKSCPPGLPLQAHLLQAETVRDALTKADFGKIPDGPDFTVDSQTRVVWEACTFSGFRGDSDIMEVHRRDEPVNRESWQFVQRSEYEGRFGEGS